MMTDIEIAQSTQVKHILEIAQAAGIDEKYVELYGRYKAKLDLSLLKDSADKEDGKLILVTAITPTPAGEGKTTTTVGLADGLKKIGKNVAVALREPSLGPVFGVPLPTASKSFHNFTVAIAHIRTPQLLFLKSRKNTWQSLPANTSYLCCKISKSTF